MANSRIHMKNVCAGLAVDRPFENTDSAQKVGKLHEKDVYRCEGRGSGSGLMRYYYYGDGYLLTPEEKEAFKKANPRTWASALNPMEMMRRLGRRGAFNGPVETAKSLYKGDPLKPVNPYQGGRRKSRRSKAKRRMTKRRR